MVGPGCVWRAEWGSSSSIIRMESGPVVIERSAGDVDFQRKISSHVAATADSDAAFAVVAGIATAVVAHDAGLAGFSAAVHIACGSVVTDSAGDNSGGDLPAVSSDLSRFSSDPA